MLTSRRQSCFTPELLTRVGLAWGAVCALLLLVHYSAISALRFPDPDDTMRLLQVRDLIAGQGWFDLTQTRVNAPDGGVPMHWSRLVDLPLAAIIIALTPLLGSASAELAALVIVPLVTLGIVMLLAARIAWRLIGGEEAMMTCLVIAMSVPVLFQLGPLRIDHHGWQIVCALAAMNGLMARKAGVGAAAVGISLAVWTSISIEGLPLAAAICGVMALRWLRNRNDRVWLTATMQSLAITSALLFIGTRGLNDLAAYCDAIGPVHIAMFAWGAAALTLLSKAEPLPKLAVLTGFGVTGAGALSVLFYAAPQCASGGGFAALDPLVEQYWYVNVGEGMPVWDQKLKTALQYVVAPSIGVIAALNLASRSHDWLRWFWIDYTIVLIAALAVSLLVARAGAVAGVIAAVPLGWQVNQWLRNIRMMRKPAPRAFALAAVMLALLPTLPLMLVGWAIPAQASKNSAVQIQQVRKASSCQIADSAPSLRALAKGEVFAPMDISPRLLLDTDHSVIATGHHRGSDGMRVVIATSLGSTAEAKETLTERGTSYVALCPDQSEALMYAAAAPDGFAARLIGDDAPEWLEPVALKQQTNLKLWRINRD